MNSPSRSFSRNLASFERRGLSPAPRIAGRERGGGGRFGKKNDKKSNTYYYTVTNSVTNTTTGQQFCYSFGYSTLLQGRPRRWSA